MADAQDINIDFAQTFQIENLDVRGRLVRLGPALDSILNAHNYPAAVSKMLAEHVTLAATLASALKYDGIFTLQTQSDGPISLLVGDVTSEGALRGYARYDEARLKDAEKSDSAEVPRLLGQGHLAFTVDQGQDMDRYQGITALDGATLADCAHKYFRQSEQLETAIKLKATVPQGKGALARAGTVAGALMVQRLPQSTLDASEAEDGWRRSVAILASLSDEELLDAGLDHDRLLFRLYHEDGVRAYEPHKLFHRCRCSRERIENTIKAMARTEIINDDGEVHVVCEFCKANYTFTSQDLDQVFQKSDA